MTNNTFKYHVFRKLKREGYKVYPLYNNNQICPFDLISVNPKGKVAGVKCKPHEHLTKEERKELLWYNIPMYVASEKYEGGSSMVHEIKIEKVIKTK